MEAKLEEARARQRRAGERMLRQTRNQAALERAAAARERAQARRDRERRALVRAPAPPRPALPRPAPEGGGGLARGRGGAPAEGGGTGSGRPRELHGLRDSRVRPAPGRRGLIGLIFRALAQETFTLQLGVTSRRGALVSFPRPHHGQDVGLEEGTILNLVVPPSVANVVLLSHHG